MHLPEDRRPRFGTAVMRDMIDGVTKDKGIELVALQRRNHTVASKHFEHVGQPFS